MNKFDTLLSLEKIKRPSDQGFLIYTYISNEEIKHLIFIPILVVKNEEEGIEKIKELIETTNYNNFLMTPLGLWINLGDTTQEKVNIIDVEDQEDKKKEKMKEEREEIMRSIQEEQKSLSDQTTIESYYYDWYCAVQNKVSINHYKEILDVAQKAYEKRLNNIKNKNMLYPVYKDTWQQVLLSRLKKRGEEDHAKAIIEASNTICKEENID